MVKNICDEVDCSSSQAAVVLYFVFLPTLVSHFFQVCPPPSEHDSTCCEFLRGIFDTVLTCPKMAKNGVGIGAVKCHAIFAEPDMNGAQA